MDCSGSHSISADPHIFYRSWEKTIKIIILVRSHRSGKS